MAAHVSDVCWWLRVAWFPEGFGAMASVLIGRTPSDGVLTLFSTLPRRCRSHGAPAPCPLTVTDGMLLCGTADAAGVRELSGGLDFWYCIVCAAGSMYGGPERTMRSASSAGPTLAQARGRACGRGAVGRRPHDPCHAPRYRAFYSRAPACVSGTEGRRCLALAACWRAVSAALGPEEPAGTVSDVHAYARTVSRLGVVRTVGLTESVHLLPSRTHHRIERRAVCQSGPCFARLHIR